MKSSGFSLIETIIVIAILSVLTLASLESIVQFQKTVILDSTANEFASALHRAQSMSITGEIPDDQDNPDNLRDRPPSDFDTNGLPQFKINLSPNTYRIGYDYKLAAAGSSVTTKYLDSETFKIDPKLSIASPVSDVTFTRLTGLITTVPFLSPPIVFEITRIDNSQKIQVIINNKGAISINHL